MYFTTIKNKNLWKMIKMVSFMFCIFYNNWRKKKTQFIHLGKTFPPFLSQKSSYNPIKIPEFFYLQTSLLFSWPTNLFPPVHPLGVFGTFRSCYLQKKKKKELFLPTQISITFPCCDVLSYILLFPSVILSTHFGTVISYRPSSLIDYKFLEDK